MSTGYHIAFWKYEGLGNDFVIVDERMGDGAAPALPVAVRRWLVDRHFGIGGDGVITLLPAENDGAVRMHITNPDGSVPEMCGNGLRCVSRYLVDIGLVPDEGGHVIETMAGPHDVRIAGGQVEVDMAVPDFSGLQGQGPMLEQAVTFGGHAFTASTVSMGNPHVVLLDAGTDRALVDAVGPALPRHLGLSAGANVSFAQQEGEGLSLVVCERGAGVTLACGTGACATVAAYVKAGRLAAGKMWPVALPGGTLFVEVPGEGERVRMRGPARRVFAAEVDVPDL